MSLTIGRATGNGTDPTPAHHCRAPRLAGHLGQVCLHAERLLEAPQSEVLRDSLRVATEQAREALDNRADR